MMLPLLSAALLGLGAGRGDSMLVTTAWLAERLGNPKLVLFQVGLRAQYDSAHIPGAQHIDLRDVSAPTDTMLHLELPDAAVLDSVLEAHGVSDDSRIVLYWGGTWLTPTTRIYLTLYWAGLGARVSILDGGLPAWRAEGRAVTAEVPAPARGTVTIRPRPDVVVTADWVAARLADPSIALVDARDRRFYEGRDTNHVRPGHIPGAASLPFVQLADSTGYLEPRARMAELLRSAHVADGDTVVAYCHIGQQATLVWFAARLLGYEARLYDGSFTQWTRLTSYPVERSP